MTDLSNPKYRLDGIFVRDLSTNPAILNLVCKDCCSRSGYVITQEQEHATDQPLPQHHCSDCRKPITWEQTPESLGIEFRGNYIAK